MREPCKSAYAALRAVPSWRRRLPLQAVGKAPAPGLITRPSSRRSPGGALIRPRRALCRTSSRASRGRGPTERGPEGHECAVENCRIRAGTARWTRVSTCGSATPTRVLTVLGNQRYLSARAPREAVRCSTVTRSAGSWLAMAGSWTTRVGCCLETREQLGIGRASVAGPLSGRRGQAVVQPASRG